MSEVANYKITKIIEKKRNGQKLSDDEIRYFVDSFVKCSMLNILQMGGIAVDRCQIGAMLMAMYLNKLDEDETSNLTEAMTNSGFVFTWPKEWSYLVVDKHSTGGVGDKVSLVLVPALAGVGLKVPMVSGRSLSHLGGTLEKLAQSIPGFRVDLNKVEIKEAVNVTGCCIVGENEDYVPADKILYECREITATADYPPFIISSIVSKKLCEGIKTLVYDVKFGKGSVFSSKEEAEQTARDLVRYSKHVKTSALLTSMENPLGKAIGNSVEVAEAIDCLKGNGPSDVVQITCALGSELIQSIFGRSREEGKEIIMGALIDGRALEKFHSMIVQQGVTLETANELCYGDASKILPKVQYDTDIVYEGIDGFILEINPLILGEVWKELMQFSQHPGIGLTLIKSVRDHITKGAAWVRIHHHRDQITNCMKAKLKSAISVQRCQKERVLIDKRLCLSENSVLIEENY